MIAYKMHFIRCGSTAEDDTPRFVGQQNLSLSNRGRKELEVLGQSLEYPTVQTVYTSPLARCQQTADLLYPETYTEVVPDFVDMCLGEFEGHSFADLKGRKDFSEWVSNAQQSPPPGGERIHDFTTRILSGFESVFRSMMEQRITNAAVITHRGVIMTLLAAIGLPKHSLEQWAVANGTGYTVLATPAMWMRDGAVEVFAAVPSPRNAPHREDDYWL